MSKDALQTTLQELQLELDKLHFDNEEHRDSVDRNLVALETKLREEGFMSGDEYLIHEIKESLSEFEEHHPKVTELIGHISDLLAKMGL